MKIKIGDYIKLDHWVNSYRVIDVDAFENHVGIVANNGDTAYFQLSRVDWIIDQIKKQNELNEMFTIVE